MSGSRAPAVVLLSGGLDSTTVVAMAMSRGFAVHALSFRYGQRHEHELDCASRVAAAHDIPHHIVNLDPLSFRGSALTDGPAVPVHGSVEEIPDGIPVTYVPARNTIMLAHALGYAEGLESRDLFIGVNAVDYSGYPDCRPAFIEAFERLANLATKSGVDGRPIRIHAPLMRLDKAEIIRAGLALGVDYGLTSTCYQPADGNRPCGGCDACLLRARGFKAAGAADPLVEG